MWGSVPAACLYFTVYEGCKSTIGDGPTFNPRNPVVHFLSGLSAEAVSCLLFVPIDVVKERVQTQHARANSASAAPELRSSDAPRTVSNLGFYRPRIREPSRVLTQQQFEVVWSWLPTEWRVLEPRRLFCTRAHGCSLTNFYHHCDPQEAPTLLLLRTKRDAVFGAFVSYGWDTSCSGYYGSGQVTIFRFVLNLSHFSVL